MCRGRDASLSLQRRAVLLCLLLKLATVESTHLSYLVTTTPELILMEGENVTFYCEVYSYSVVWRLNETTVYSGGDLHVTYTSGEIISGSYAFRQSNLTIVAVGLHYDNTTLQCCTTDLVQCSQVLTLHVVEFSIAEPEEQYLEPVRDLSLELVNRTGAVRLTWELPPGLDPSIITHYTVAVTGDEQLFNSTAVSVTDTYFTYTLPWLAWQQQPTCSLVNFSVSMWNILGTEGKQAHQNAFLCNFRELEVEQVYVERECDGDSTLPTVVSSCPGNTKGIVGSAIPVILLLCMGNIILVLVIIFTCIKMNKIKTTLSDSRRKSEPKDENIVMEENNAYEMIKMGRPGGAYEQQPQLTAATSAECRDKFKQFRVAAPATVTTDGPTVASHRRAETVVPVPPIPGPVPTVSHVHTHVPLVGSQLDDEAPPPPIPPHYHDDQ